DPEDADHVDSGEIAVAQHAYEGAVLDYRNVANRQLSHHFPSLGNSRLRCHGQRIGRHQVASNHQILPGLSLVIPSNPDHFARGSTSRSESVFSVAGAYLLGRDHAVLAEHASHHEMGPLIQPDDPPHEGLARAANLHPAAGEDISIAPAGENSRCSLRAEALHPPIEG